MKVQITFDLSDDDRRAIYDQVGIGGGALASHGHCRKWIDKTVRGTLEVLRAEYADTVEDKA